MLCTHQLLKLQRGQLLPARLFSELFVPVARRISIYKIFLLPLIIPTFDVVAILFNVSMIFRLIRLRPCLALCHLKPNVRYSSSSAQGDIVDSILCKPTWSVQSLLPDSSTASQSSTVSPKELHHLLRLSALPQPSNPAEEQDMLQTLESQIHFVKEIQRVDTTDIPPLRGIRDETAESMRENTIGLSDLKPTLDRETRVGRTRRIQRRKTDQLEHPDGETWDGDALKSANKKVGKYFVVQSGSD